MKQVIPFYKEIVFENPIANLTSISLEHNEPMRFKLKIDSTKLSSRVAKSQTATISIPDLGLKVEPGGINP